MNDESLKLQTSRECYSYNKIIMKNLFGFTYHFYQLTNVLEI